MIPRLLIDSVPIPGGGGSLRLFQRGDEYAIMLGGNELMNSRKTGSEEALATEACARIAGVAAPAVLIGGLGMGFTLRAALEVLPAQARIVVAELVPGVVAWARGPMAGLFGSSLDDPRVEIVEGDVGALMQAGGSRFDAILLDVDNGPDGLTRAGNDRLYDPAGLRVARGVLRSGGVLAVWSSGPSPRFTARLSEAGFRVDEIVVRSRGGRGGRHILWMATRP